MNSIIKVGAKVRLEMFPSGFFVEITAVGRDRFLGNSFGRRKNGDVICDGNESPYKKNMLWLPYEEPKKKVMMYPALLKTNASDSKTGYLVTESLFETEEEAKDRYTYAFVKLLTDRGIEVEQ